MLTISENELAIFVRIEKSGGKRKAVYGKVELG